MKAEDKIKKIIETVESGKTVYFTTYLRQTPVNLKTLNKFRDSGYELFKATKNSMFIRNGKKWDCVDYCRITVS